MHNQAKNKYVNFSKNAWIQGLLRSPLVGVAVHWLFQGMIYMDGLERGFKIFLDLILTLLFKLALRDSISALQAWVLAWLVAHTLNFLFNGQVWVVLKHYGLVNQTYDKFDRYTHAFIQRVQAKDFIAYAALYGSVAREQWKPSSDLDVRLVQKSGLFSGIRSCIFVLLERTRALFSGFPLDVYVFGSAEHLNRRKMKEDPVVVKSSVEPGNQK